jgi:hypothetical protein
MGAFVRYFRVLTILSALVLLVSCGPRMMGSGGVPGAPAPPAAVERFLQLASESDYAGMGWVFGTADGAIMQRDPPGQVEQRMYALASLLEYDSFVVGVGSPVPGRTGDALRFDVQIRRGFETLQVPFVVVRGPQTRWYVEQLEVEALTGGG